MLQKSSVDLFSKTASIPKFQKDPSEDAWLTNFFTENHLDFETQPDQVASPEQVRFVVHLPEIAIYYPCSTELFEAILNKQSKSYLHERYQRVWAIVERLVQDQIGDESYYHQRADAADPVRVTHKDHVSDRTHRAKARTLS